MYPQPCQLSQPFPHQPPLQGSCGLPTPRINNNLSFLSQHFPFLTQQKRNSFPSKTGPSLATFQRQLQGREEERTRTCHLPDHVQDNLHQGQGVHPAGSSSESARVPQAPQVTPKPPQVTPSNSPVLKLTDEVLIELWGQGQGHSGQRTPPVQSLSPYFLSIPAHLNIPGSAGQGSETTGLVEGVPSREDGT